MTNASNKPSHKHAPRYSETIGFTGAVSGAYNPSAHGGVTEIQECTCGAQRRVNINGAHEEIGSWDMPEWLVDMNPLAVSTPAYDTRRYLVALAKSTRGAEAIEAAGYGAILGKPDRGDAESTRLVASLAGSKLTEILSARN